MVACGRGTILCFPAGFHAGTLPHSKAFGPRVGDHRGGFAAGLHLADPDQPDSNLFPVPVPRLGIAGRSIAGNLGTSAIQRLGTTSGTVLAWAGIDPVGDRDDAGGDRVSRLAGNGARSWHIDGAGQRSGPERCQSCSAIRPDGFCRADFLFPLPLALARGRSVEICPRDLFRCFGNGRMDRAVCGFGNSKLAVCRAPNPPRTPSGISRGAGGSRRYFYRHSGDRVRAVQIRWISVPLSSSYPHSYRCVR